MRIPYALAVFAEEERRAVSEVLETPQIVAGEKAKLFEEKIAELFGKKFGVFVNSGSSANLLALEVVNLPAGSEVITPVLTFATTVAPIVQKKLVPAFVDVEAGRYVIDAERVEKAISGRTRALMIPSLLGNVPDLPKLRTIAHEHNLLLIEDSCDTLGATIDGKPTGSHSDISTTSFYASHIITAAGEGGMICVNDAFWNRKARIMSGWGRRSALNESEDITRRYETSIGTFPYDSKFIFDEVGYNMRTTDIAAAFGLAQLKKLGTFSNIRNRNFTELKKFFKKYEEVFILPEQMENVHTNWLAFPLTIRKGAPFSRLEIVQHLEHRDVQTRPVFTGNILRQPGFEGVNRIGSVRKFPHADSIMQNGFVIACHHGLTEEHIDYLKNVFEEFLAAKTAI